MSEYPVEVQATTFNPEAGGMSVATAQPTGMMQVAQSRAAQEVQAAMVIAKQCPRDQNASYTRIMQATKRETLAKTALYSYRRGGTDVTGPSIRLAEVLAQAWGNLDFGIVELDQRFGESSVMAYCWDLETNTRQTKIFTVKHERHTKQGKTNLTDPRDIYEMVANQGARRLRACILGIIPGDVQEDAVNGCKATLEHGGGIPLADRIRKMVAAFSELGVTQEMLETRLCHNLEATNATEIVTMTGIYQSLRDGAADVRDFFQVQGAAGQEAPAPTGDRAADVAAKIAVRRPRQKVDCPPVATPSEPEPTIPYPEAAMPAAGATNAASTGAGIVFEEPGPDSDPPAEDATAKRKEYVKIANGWPEDARARLKAIHMAKLEEGYDPDHAVIVAFETVKREFKL